MTLYQIALGFLFAALCSTHAWQATRAQEVRPETQEELHDKLPADDPPFAKFLDMKLLAAALHDGDAVRLTDLALVLAEGERILLRPHKSIPASSLMRQAVKAASAQRDKASLQRLAKVLEARGDKELTEHVNTTLALIDVARKTPPMPVFTEDEKEQGAVEEYREFQRGIERAVRLHDKDGLAAVKDALGNGVLSEAQVAPLAKMIEEANKNLSSPSSEQDGVLALLAAQARSSDTGMPTGAAARAAKQWFDQQGVSSTRISYVFYRIGPNQAKLWYKPLTPSVGPFSSSINPPATYNAQIYKFALDSMGKKVGKKGECGEFVEAAVAKFIGAGALRTFGDYPRAGDYVWGKRVATITPTDQSGVSKILPGDLLQYRNCTFKGKFKLDDKDRDWDSNAAHHSAIVSYVSPSGTFVNTFTQNTDTRRFVVHGLTSFFHMKTGTIWVYRAAKSL